jgi:hypothetical protein
MFHIREIFELARSGTSHARIALYPAFRPQVGQFWVQISNVIQGTDLKSSLDRPGGGGSGNCFLQNDRSWHGGVTREPATSGHSLPVWLWVKRAATDTPGSG